MEKVVVLNLKMNLSYDEVMQYIESIKSFSSSLIVCPSFVYIPYFISAGYVVGAQDTFYDDFGSFTGEVSPRQLKSLGTEYVIVGHSERRRLFHESNYVINKKIKRGIANGLKVIFCVGEEEKDKDNYREILFKQITEGLDGVSGDVFISYEPVWAIGSANPIDKSRLLEVVNYIKSLRPDCKVLYGGSVNSESACLLNMDELSGFLVGSASLDYDEVKKIIEVVK
jgi:triosephosphate isomerase (TIM)